ncbi:MAG: hypothetical protein AAB628_01835 [Patescibacteria group bacterium]
MLKHQNEVTWTKFANEAGFNKWYKIQNTKEVLEKGITLERAIELVRRYKMTRPDLLSLVIYTMPNIKFTFQEVNKRLELESPFIEGFSEKEISFARLMLNCRLEILKHEGILSRRNWTRGYSVNIPIYKDGARYAALRWNPALENLVYPKM